MIKLKLQPLTDGSYELRVLMTHPMENGRNREPLTGELIPAHYIETLVIQLNDTPIIQSELGGSVAKNPFFSFRFSQLTEGDRLSVTWHDNLGNSATQQTTYSQSEAHPRSNAE